jgi:hypothetical protein
MTRGASPRADNFILSELGGIEEYCQYIEEIQLGRRRAPNDFNEALFGRRRASEAFVAKQEERKSPCDGLDP